MEKFKDIIEKIEKMSVLELHELVKILEEKFGVSAAAVAVQSTGGGAIAVMKVVKEVLGLGLKEAKDLVDTAPSTLKEGMKKTEAEDLKKKIEAAGGKIELK